MKNCRKHWNRLLTRFVRATALIFVRIYQVFLSGYTGGNCRFYPSCSEYAVQALNHYSPIKAFTLVLKRLLKCHPFGGKGYDPVPSKPRKDHHVYNI